MRKIISILTNKYLVASVFFIVWMLFFDQRDVFQQRDRQADLKKTGSQKIVLCTGNCQNQKGTGRPAEQSGRIGKVCP